MTGTLNFVSEIFKNLSLNIEDAEFLRNAFLVQPLVAPLVRFSNHGRYEPYVARSWNRDNNNWIFEIMPGLICEDGQIISPAAIAHSLVRSLKNHSPDELRQTPFVYLEGIEDLHSSENLQKGIVATENHLKLRFRQPVGLILLEYLAMTPYAFLCDANFLADKWISHDKFVSSGPYRVAEFSPSREVYELEAREDWALNTDVVLKKIRLTDKEDVHAAKQIRMTYAELKHGAATKLFHEVPRALVSIRLGTDDSKFFGERASRRLFSQTLNKVIEKNPVPFVNYYRASSFFYGQSSGHELPVAEVKTNDHQPNQPLLMRRRNNQFSADSQFLEGLVMSALDELNWPYEFVENDHANAASYYGGVYDISLDTSHVDLTADPGFIQLLFLSKFGPKYGDPGNRIAQLLENYDSGHVKYRDFLTSFNSIIAEEAAVIPLFHRGFAWEFPPSIDTQTLNPLLSVLRYETLTT